MNHTTVLLLFLFLTTGASGCSKGSPASTTTTPPTSDTLIKGADIGWLSEMEATGYKFYDSTGKQQDCLDILQSYGINSLRLRVWVNPSSDPINGHCSLPETVTMAKRAIAKGFKLMIDFHYSDSWADPSKQTKPAAWTSHSFSQLTNDVYTYTYHVLDTLQQQGCAPTWVQIGNEITNGMLWPDGSTNNWGQLSQLLNQGYAATKSVSSNIKVIIHIDQGNNNGRCRWFFDSVTHYQVNYDIIGLSYYPYWLGTDYTATISDLGSNMNDISARYNKPVMIAEIGGVDTAEQNTYNLLTAAIAKVKAIPNKQGAGIFYWEPEGARSWSNYALSCWRSNGQPSSAMAAFRN